MQFVYDEERSGYIIPITGTTSAYTPKVVKIKTSVKEKRVTVGYVAPPTGLRWMVRFLPSRVTPRSTMIISSPGRVTAII